jgi:uncharacterized membrane protein (UPF0127 family)
VSLDILFVDASGNVVDIAEDTAPYSTRAIVPNRPAMAVLEVPAGTVAYHGVRLGAQVQHPLFERKNP